MSPDIRLAHTYLSCGECLSVWDPAEVGGITLVVCEAAPPPPLCNWSIVSSNSNCGYNLLTVRLLSGGGLAADRLNVSSVPSAGIEAAGSATDLKAFNQRDIWLCWGRRLKTHQSVFVIRWRVINTDVWVVEIKGKSHWPFLPLIQVVHWGKKLSELRAWGFCLSHNEFH